jgi:hypothetical protein
MVSNEHKNFVRTGALSVTAMLACMSNIPAAPARYIGPIHERGIGQMGEIQVLLAS